MTFCVALSSWRQLLALHAMTLQWARDAATGVDLVEQTAAGGVAELDISDGTVGQMFPFEACHGVSRKTKSGRPTGVAVGREFLFIPPPVP